MTLDDISQSPVKEALTTKRDLQWEQEAEGTLLASFSIDDREYQLVVRLESLRELTFARIDFSFNSSPIATDLHKDQFKVLGIVKNGIIDHFLPKVDGFFFVAKARTDPEHYASRVRLYRRLSGWASAELGLIAKSEVDQHETIFYLAKTKESLGTMLGE